MFRLNTKMFTGMCVIWDGEKQRWKGTKQKTNKQLLPKKLFIEVISVSKQTGDISTHFKTSKMKKSMGNIYKNTLNGCLISEVSIEYV